MDTDINPNEDERILSAQLLSNALVQNMTIETFALNCGKIWDSWIHLLSQTLLPPEISSRDPRFTIAFQAIEGIISTTQGILQWLAYAQLIRLFDTLRETIRRERRIGIYNRKRGVTDDSTAIDIYQNALDSKLSRNTILERRRIGRRWVSLSKLSPLLLLLYSERTETIV